MATFDILGTHLIQVGHVVTGTPDTIGYLSVPDGNGFTLGDYQTEDIEIPTQGSTRSYQTINRLTGEWGHGSFSQELMERLFGAFAAPVTAGVEVGTTSIQYFGHDGESRPKTVEVRATLLAKNVTTDTNQNVRMVVPKVKHNPPGFPDAPNTGAMLHTKAWRSDKTTNDIIGSTARFPSAPPGGFYYAMQVLNS